MEVRLTAGKNPLFVLDLTETVSTRVKYESPQPIFLWRRVNGTTWTTETLTDTAASAAEFTELEKQGVRTTPTLRAGEFVEYGALAENLDPNSAGFKRTSFLAYLLIDVLLNSTTLVAKGPDTGLFPGGTFVRQRVATTRNTRLQMIVGREPAVADANGFLRLPNPVTDWVYSDFAQLHDVEAEPLVSGTSHVALTLLIADTGAWQTIAQVFTTKRREVKIQFKQFIVVNDADRDPPIPDPHLRAVAGVGDEAEIFFRVYSGRQMVKQFKWGPGTISDVLAREVGLGFPDALVSNDIVDGIDPGVGVSIYGFERDWFVWIKSKDEARPELRKGPGEGYSTIRQFVLPHGSSKENINPPMTETNFAITATPTRDDDGDLDGELTLTAKVRYEVRYVD